MIKKIILLAVISMNIAFNCVVIIAAPLNSDNNKAYLQLDSPDVWISSEAKGIELYNIRKNAFIKYDIDRDDLLKIIRTENDYLVVNRSGINKIDGKTKELSSITKDIFPKDKAIECVNNNEKGLYAGLKGIIGYYDYSEKKWQKWELPDDFKDLKIINVVPSENLLIIITEKNILKFKPIEKEYRLVSDQDGINKEVIINKNNDKFCIVSDKNIRYFDAKILKSVELDGLDNKSIKQIWMDEGEYKNDLWLAGETFLLKYDLINKKIEDYTKECLISEPVVKGGKCSIENVIRINDLKTDENKVWIATNGGGMIEIDTNGIEHKTRIWTENNGLPSNFVESLAIDDNRIFACFNDGLARLEKHKGKWDIIRNPSEIKILNNDELKIDKLVAADDYYGFLNKSILFLYMRKDGKWIEIRKNIKDAVEDKNILWMLSNDNKIITHDLENGEQEIIYPIDNFNSKIVCNLMSDKNFIYAGITDGVFIYNKKDKMWGQISNAGSKTISFLADDHIFVWIGTVNNGVIRYNKKSKNIKIYGKAEGLLDDSVSLIGVDQEYIWVVHKNQSISRMSKMTQYWDTFEKGTKAHPPRRASRHKVAKLQSDKEKDKNQETQVTEEGEVFIVKKFIPNVVLDPQEKRWQISKDWKVFKEVKGGRGGKWIEGEIAIDMSPTQIYVDRKLSLTWFINDKKLVKYNRGDDTYDVEEKNDYLIRSDNKLSLEFEKHVLKVIDMQLN